MQAVPLTQEHRAAALAVGAGLRAILMGLAALVAHAFLRDPFRVGLINPLWTRLTRAARRFDRLMARVAAGKERPRPSSRAIRAVASPATQPRPRQPSFPSRRMWLVVALRHHGAVYMGRLEHLLSDPRTAELIAAVPQAVSLLRPLCHMLGVTHPAIPKRPRSGKKPPAAQRRTGEGGATRQMPPPAAPEPPPRPLCETVPCDHVGWPWFPGRFSRNA